MIAERLQMLLLLSQLLLEVKELFLLTLTDSIILVGLFALLEGVAVMRSMISHVDLRVLRRRRRGNVEMARMGMLTLDHR